MYFLFSESFGDADLWRDALTQNAWDTGTAVFGVIFIDNVSC